MPPVRATIILALVFGASMLTGCDKLSGAADQKSADAEAIGYACRVSGKSPEDCMKENEAFSPSDILGGWKNAADDIKNKVVSEGSAQQPAEEKPVEKPAAKLTEKPAEKPAGDSANKDAKAADAKGAAH